MPSLTKDDLIPLVNKIRELTGRNYCLSKSRGLLDNYFALHCDGNDMCGQGYVPICDLFEQMNAYFLGIKVGMTVAISNLQKEKP